MAAPAPEVVAEPEPEPEPESEILPPALDDAEETPAPEPVLIDEEPSLFVESAPVESVPLVKIRVPAKAQPAPAPEPEVDVDELVETEPFVELEPLEEAAPLPAPTPKSKPKVAPPAKVESKPAKAAPALEPAPAPRQVKQEELIPKKPATRGRFEKSEPTVIDGEDLDVPTFLRKKP